MAQQQTNITLPSPGYFGLNTEDSPLTQDPSYASQVDNAVIDRYGRVGAREAFATATTTFPTAPSIPSAVTVTLDLKFIASGRINGVDKVLCLGQWEGKDGGGTIVGYEYGVFEHSGATLTELTLPTINDEATLEFGEIIVTDDRFYIFSATNETMIWDGTTLNLISDQTGYQGIQDIAAGPQVAPTFTTGIAAYGRIWATGHEGDQNTVYWSDLLIGASHFTVDGIDPDSTAGRINVLENWPNGRDEVMGLAAHNNRLIVFGRNAILVFNAGYGDPADPASGFALEDTIDNVGLISRDALVSIGTDILFVDETGVRSLGRTIQERSSPMGDLTVKVRKQLTDSLAEISDPRIIKMEYDSSRNFVVLGMGPSEAAICLDLRNYLRDGMAKVTRWTDCYFNDMSFLEGDTPRLLLAGTTDYGVLEYSGYLSAGNPYVFKYASNRLSFGDPARSKFLKQVDFTLLSANNPAVATLRWGYDSLDNVKSKSINVDAEVPALYNVDEFNNANFGGSDVTIRRYKVNTGGRGETVVLGFQCPIEGNSISLQEINVQTLIGRIN